MECHVHESTFIWCVYGRYLVLYAIPWPANGTLKDFVDKLKDYLEEKKYYRKIFI